MIIGFDAETQSISPNYQLTNFSLLPAASSFVNMGLFLTQTHNFN